MSYTPPATHAEILAKEWLTIEDVAVLLSVTVDSVRTKIKTGSLPQPRRSGRRLYWKKSVFLNWMDGGDGAEPWTPQPYTPRPGTPSAAGRR